MAKPVLWHIPVSHYSEKVRWALALKGVEHERKAPPGGVHMAVALALTGGKQHTFPVLQVEGRRIGDSTAIIAELERRFPEPPLYPADPADRERALALEEWFDEEIGPPVRLLAWHELTRDRDVLEGLSARMLPPPLARFRGAGAAVAGSFVKVRYGAGAEEAAEAARGAVVAGLDRLEAELGDREYLVGATFSVADLTAASLFYPLVQPPEGPRLLEGLPDALEQFVAPLRDRRGYRWIEKMFRRHRKPSVAS